MKSIIRHITVLSMILSLSWLGRCLAAEAGEVSEAALGEEFRQSLVPPRKQGVVEGALSGAATRVGRLFQRKAEEPTIDPVTAGLMPKLGGPVGPSTAPEVPAPSAVAEQAVPAALALKPPEPAAPGSTGMIPVTALAQQAFHGTKSQKPPPPAPRPLRAPERTQQDIQQDIERAETAKRQSAIAGAEKQYASEHGGVSATGRPQSVRAAASGKSFFSGKAGKGLAIGAGVAGVTALALGTTAGIVASIKHTQSFIIDQSVLDVPGNHDIKLNYMFLPGKDHIYDFSFRVLSKDQAGKSSKRVEIIDSHASSDVTVADDGKSLTINVKKGAWCLKHITVDGKSYEVKGNNCSSFKFKITRDTQGVLSMQQV